MEQFKTLKRTGGRVATKNIPVPEGFFNVDKEMSYYRDNGDPYYTDQSRRKREYQIWLKNMKKNEIHS